MTIIHRLRGSGTRRSSKYNKKPVLRFLETKIGCLWDEVYHEICTAVTKDTAREKIDDILRWGVERQIMMVEDHPYRWNNWDSNYIPLYDDLYVNPDTGRICKAPPPPPQTDNINNNTYYHPTNPLVRFKRIKGIWYEITYRYATDEGSPPMIPIKRRQLNSKEIKRYIRG